MMYVWIVEAHDLLLYLSYLIPDEFVQVRPLMITSTVIFCFPISILRFELCYRRMALTLAQQCSTVVSFQRESVN